MPAARQAVTRPCGPSLQPYKSRMDALRVGYAWEPQDDIAPIIPKSRKGVAVPSRTVRVFDTLVGGVSRADAGLAAEVKSCLP